MADLSCTRRIWVRFNEADPLGIVWHGHYLMYFEDAREEFGKKYGLSYADFYKNDLAVPVVSAHVDYKKPLRFGDEIWVHCVFEPSSSAKIIFNYTVYTIQNPTELVASGYTIQVFVNIHTFELQLNNPVFFKDWLQKNSNI